MKTQRDTPIKMGALANKNSGPNDLKNTKLKCSYVSNLNEKTSIQLEYNPQKTLSEDDDIDLAFKPETDKKNIDDLFLKEFVSDYNNIKQKNANNFECIDQSDYEGS